MDEGREPNLAYGSEHSVRAQLQRTSTTQPEIVIVIFKCFLLIFSFVYLHARDETRTPKPCLTQPFPCPSPSAFV